MSSSSLSERFGSFIVQNSSENDMSYDKSAGKTIDKKNGEKLNKGYPDSAMEVAKLADEIYQEVMRDMKSLVRQFIKEFPVRPNPKPRYKLRLKTCNKKTCKSCPHSLYWAKYLCKDLPAVYDQPEVYARDISRPEIQNAGFQQTIPLDIGGPALDTYKPAKKAQRSKSIFIWQNKKSDERRNKNKDKDKDKSKNKNKKTDTNYGLPPVFFRGIHGTPKYERFMYYNTRMIYLNKKRKLIGKIRYKIIEQYISLTTNGLFESQE